VLANQGILVGLPSESFATNEEIPSLKTLSILYVEDITGKPVIFNSNSPGALELLNALLLHPNWHTSSQTS